MNRGMRFANAARDGSPRERLETHQWWDTISGAGAMTFAFIERKESAGLGKRPTDAHTSPLTFSFSTSGELTSTNKCQLRQCGWHGWKWSWRWNWSISGVGCRASCRTFGGHRCWARSRALGGINSRVACRGRSRLGCRAFRRKHGGTLRRTRCGMWTGHRRWSRSGTLRRLGCRAFRRKQGGTFRRTRCGIRTGVHRGRFDTVTHIKLRYSLASRNR